MKLRYKYFKGISRENVFPNFARFKINQIGVIIPRNMLRPT